MKIGVHKLPASFQDNILNAGYKKVCNTLYSVSDLNTAFIALHENVTNWSCVELYFHVIEGCVDGFAEYFKNIMQTQEHDLKLDELVLGIASIFNCAAKVDLYVKEQEYGLFLFVHALKKQNIFCC